MSEKFGKFYDKYYKAILIIPAILLLGSLIYLYAFSQATGDIIRKDVTLTGGTSITVLDSQVDVSDLEQSIEEQIGEVKVRKLSDFRTREQQGFFIESKEDSDVVKNSLEDYLGYELTQENSSIEFTGSTLSEGFYKQIRFAIILAFIFMAAVVFFVFRTFVPSFAVILSAFADIVMTIVAVNLFGMEVSIAGIIAVLMLIGYSVDTDILLTSRMLKDKDGSLNSRMKGALKTGLTMTLTSIVAVAVALVIIYNLSETLRQIFTILLIGLGFDIFNTWFANAGILKWYIERKDGVAK